MLPVLGTLQSGVQFTTGFLVKILLSWVNNRFVVAAVRWELLVSWATALLDRHEELMSPATAVSANTVLERLIPHESTLSAQLRTLWFEAVAPTMAVKDAAVAQLDGCHFERVYSGELQLC